MRLRPLILLGVIGAAVLWVTTTGLPRDVVYFVTPTELVRDGGSAGQRLRLAGQVEPSSIRRHSDGVSFTISDGRTRVEVRSNGGAPALFGSGSQVVAEGTYRSDGVFLSDNILIKHSADYRPPEPGEKPLIDETTS